MTIGERIKKRRLELGLSQEELAKRLGNKSRASVCTVEKDKEDLTTDRIRKYADALETTPAYLMGWEESRIANLLNVSDRSDFLYSFTNEEVNILKRIRKLEEQYSIAEIERGLEFIELYQKAIPEIQAAVQSLLKSQKHDS